MPTISVILAVYNAEKYLKNAIESVLSQSLNDLELIIVDDGSTDGSSAICDKYLTHEKVKVIHIPNGGPINARRTGVEASCGEWICFIDADDTMTPDALEKLLGASNDADIVIGEHRHVPQRAPRVLDSDTYRRMMLRNIGEVQVSLWAHIFRRELFTPDTFAADPGLLVGEDWVTNIRLSFNIKRKIVSLSDYIYNYTLDNPGSILHVVKKKSPAVLDFLRKELIKAIPEEQLSSYLPEITWKELLELDWFFHSHPGDKEYMKSDFFKHILQDVKDSGMEMPYWLDEIIRGGNSFIANKIAYLKRHFRKKKEKDIFTDLWR